MRESKEDNDAALEFNHLKWAEAANLDTDVGAAHRGDLVDHDEAINVDASRTIGGNRHPKKRGVNRGRGTGADCQRLGCIEQVILHYHRWARFVCVNTARD